MHLELEYILSFAVWLYTAGLIMVRQLDLGSENLREESWCQEALSLLLEHLGPELATWKRQIGFTWVEEVPLEPKVKETGTTEQTGIEALSADTARVNREEAQESVSRA